MQEIGKLEQQEIDRLKSIHAELYCIKVKDDDGNTHLAYCKKPNLEVISAAAKHAQTDPVKSGLIMYNSCVLEASNGIATQDDLKMSVIGKIGQIFKVREAELEKL